MNFFLERKKDFFNENLALYFLQKISYKSNKTKLQKKIFSSVALKSDIGTKKIFKILKWEFKTTAFNVSAITSKNIESLSKLIYQSHNSKIQKNKYELVLNDFKSQSPISLSVNDWHKLGFICNANGLFRLSGICRKKATDFVIKRYENNKNIVSSIAMFKVCLDLGDYTKAEKIIKKAISINKSDYVRYLYENFYNYKNPPIIKPLDHNQTLFNKLINNKKIAIVAPGLVERSEEVIKDINSYDLIVFFTYKGNKIDNRFNIPFISYYNTGAGSKLKDSFKDCVSDLEFSVFKKKSHRYQHELISKGMAKKVDRNLNEFFFVQQPNLLQIVLDDLLMYSAQKIKVFGANFYLNKNIYVEGYLFANTATKELSEMWSAFSYHNILSQVNYVRNLYKINSIELDQACFNVVDMNEEELLTAYESMYSNIE